MMNACPCCGFTAGKKTPVEIAELVSLSRLERVIFDTLAAQFGRFVPGPALADAVYADDPDGGPFSAVSCVGVRTISLRKKIEPFGLVIDGRTGPNGGRRMTWKGGAE